MSVFKAKYQQVGAVERPKTQLAAKGPVFSCSGLRTIVAYAANDDFQLGCWDLARSLVQQPLDVGHMCMVTPGG